MPPRVTRGVPAARSKPNTRTTPASARTSVISGWCDDAADNGGAAKPSATTAAAVRIKWLRFMRKALLWFARSLLKEHCLIAVHRDSAGQAVARIGNSRCAGYRYGPFQGRRRTRPAVDLERAFRTVGTVDTGQRHLDELSLAKAANETSKATGVKPLRTANSPGIRRCRWCTSRVVGVPELQPTDAAPWIRSVFAPDAGCTKRAGWTTADRTKQPSCPDTRRPCRASPPTPGGSDARLRPMALADPRVLAGTPFRGNPRVPAGPADPGSPWDPRAPSRRSRPSAPPDRRHPAGRRRRSSPRIRRSGSRRPRRRPSSASPR